MSEDANKVEHSGWDRGDYDVDDLGGFSGVEPGGDEYWAREHRRCLDRLNDMGEEPGEVDGANNPKREVDRLRIRLKMIRETLSEGDDG